MKKIIIILALVSCSEKRAELIKEIQSDTLITQDTMISSFANEIKGISKSIKSNDVYVHKYKDSVTKQLKSVDLKAKYLKMENQSYMKSIDGYVEILGTEGVIDAYLKAGTKDTTK